MCFDAFSVYSDVIKKAFNFFGRAFFVKSCILYLQSYLPPYDIIHRVQTKSKSLQVLLLRVIEGSAASIHFVDEQAFKRRWFRHRRGHEPDDVFAGKDLWSGKDMGVNKSLIDPQEGLVSAGTNPGSLSSIFGTDVGHRRRLGIPVGHVQDGPSQLSFLESQQVNTWTWISQSKEKCVLTKQECEIVSHREAAKRKDLPIHQENCSVVTARCHLDTWTRKSLHQSRRTPGREIDLSFGTICPSTWHRSHHFSFLNLSRKHTFSLWRVSYFSI